MDRDMLSIDQILPNTSAGDGDDVGGKALAIRMWISSVLRKIIRYKAQHHSLLNEAATTLQHALPQDIMMNNVLPFLELPSFTFEGGDTKRKRKKLQNDNARQDDNVANLSAMLKEGLLENEEQNDAIMMLNQQLTDALATMSMIVDSVRCNSELRIRVSELERENALFVEQRDELEQEVARLVEAGEALVEENDHLGDEVAILEILHEANEGLVEENEELLESSRVYQFVSIVCGAATRLTYRFRKRVNSNENNECYRPTKRVRLSDAC
ncbi:hypothetical protein QTG54_011474 [Skeletonema marinoi]|uniref:Uncharacterized protein n=1 Tax=Skeletonema marinoi TaxID=267567 RepID=A0AAD8Y1I7_9STRA|nr:hypothetical protein QTG54_011474 [Skeletonema marinoi]